ncbi:hypothetical protein HK102_006269, partial [Quaeritorhiza haematococci]
MGYRYAQSFIVSVMENVVDFASLIASNENFKDLLQRFYQSKRWPNPCYVDSTPLTSSRNFHRGVLIHMNNLATFDDH